MRVEDNEVGQTYWTTQLQLKAPVPRFVSQPMGELEERLRLWFKRGDRGTSSCMIVATALGDQRWLRQLRSTSIDPWPHDIQDFGRCHRLLEQVPDVREKAFMVLGEIFPTWARFIRDWDALTSAYLAALEEWEKVKDLPQKQQETPRAEALYRWISAIRTEGA